MSNDDTILGILHIEGFTWNYTERKDKVPENIILSAKYTRLSTNGHIVSMFPYFIDIPITSTIELGIISQYVKIGDKYEFTLAYVNIIEFKSQKTEIPAYITEFVAKVNQYKGLSAWKMEVPTWFPEFAKLYVQRENGESEHTVS